MNDAVFAIPGDLSAATGGYAYDRRVMAECAAMGFHLVHLALPGGYPHPNSAMLESTRARLAACPPGQPLLIDGLALGAFDEATLDAIKGPPVGLVHHPLAFETGLRPARREALLASERVALRRCGQVITTSEATLDLLVQHYDVPASRITVAEPGVEQACRARGSADRTIRLLAVGAISPRKAYPLLIEALAGLAALPWALTIAGPTLDGGEEERVRRIIANSGLEKRVTLAGRVDDEQLARLYEGADLFVMPSSFEGYGMAITEALARGLPIVSTTGGALARTVPDDASLKVPADDMLSFRAALRQMIEDHGLRHGKADNAWRRAESLPRWCDTATTIMGVLKGASL